MCSPTEESGARSQTVNSADQRQGSRPGYQSLQVSIAANSGHRSAAPSQNASRNALQTSDEAAYAQPLSCGACQPCMPAKLLRAELPRPCRLHQEFRAGRCKGQREAAATCNTVRSQLCSSCAQQSRQCSFASDVRASSRGQSANSMSAARPLVDNPTAAAAQTLSSCVARYTFP